MVTKTYKNYRAHRGQARYHRSKASTRLILSPIRSGKTTAICMEAIKSAWNVGDGESYPLPSILLCAPTYAQVKSLLYDSVKSICLDAGLLHSAAASPGSMQISLANGRQMYFRSLAAGAQEAVRGITAHECFIDECALVSEEAVDIVRGRLITTRGRLTLATTPKGKANWVYEKFFRTDPPVNTDIIRFTMEDNPAISWDYLEELQQTYSPAFFKQECLGEFVSLAENRVYYSFDSSKHVGTAPMPPSPHSVKWFIGLDYNVGKNATIIGYVRAPGDFVILRELYGSLSTQALIPEIKKIVPAGAPLVIYDDSNSGHARNQLTGQTNRDLMRSAGFSTHSRLSNPAVVERIDRVNAVFYNKNILIDSSCRRLINELEEMEYKDASTTPNDQGGKVGHITDAFGYAMFELNPLARAVSKQVIFN